MLRYNVEVWNTSQEMQTKQIESIFQTVWTISIRFFLDAFRSNPARNFLTLPKKRNAFPLEEFCPNNDCDKTGSIIHPVYLGERVIGISWR